MPLSQQHDLSKLVEQVAEHGAEIKSLTHAVRDFVNAQEKINAALFKAASPNIANLIALVGVIAAIITLLGFFVFRDIDTAKTIAAILLEKQTASLAAVDVASHERDAVMNDRMAKQNEHITKIEEHQWDTVKMDMEELHQRRMQQQTP